MKRFNHILSLMNLLEDSFSCTGWCETTYVDDEPVITIDTCVNNDLITPCNCTVYDHYQTPHYKACNTCVSKHDKKSSCSNYTKYTHSMEKYMFSNVNK